MRITIALTCSMVLGLAALTPEIACAQQHPGFRIAIAQAQQPAVARPASPVSPISPGPVVPFAAAPAVVAPVQPVQPINPTVIIPNQVLLPGQTTIVPATLGPAPAIAVSVPVIAVPVIATPVVPAPSVIIFTGTTVVFQNGHSFGPR